LPNLIGFHSDEVHGAATLPMFRLLTMLAAMAMGAAFAHPAAAAVFTLTVASTASTGLAACSWDRPGHDSFMGDVPAAVDRYTDIAPAVRERLKARMRAHDYDDVVEISRDRISGNADYEPGIRDMHFGQGRVCGTVSRAGWMEDHRERALVYCEGQDCVMVPTVCRNVSRIARVPGNGGGSARPPGDDELLFDPPGAGAPAPVPGDAPAPLSTLPPSPLTGVPTTPPGAFVTPPRVAIGPPSTGAPPTGLPTPPIFVLPPAVTEPPPIVVPPVGPPVAPPIAPVPEPSTWAMLAAGLGMLACWIRRSRTCARSSWPSRPWHQRRRGA